LESAVPIGSGVVCLVASGPDLYFVPLAPTTKDGVDIVCEHDGIRWGDGLEDEQCVRELLYLCLEMTPGGAFSSRVVDRSALQASLPGAVQTGSPDQTNSWCVCGDSFLKVFRRLETEPNLDVEVLAVLAHRQDLSIPHLRGVLSVTHGRGTSIAMAVQKALVHQGNAWERACAEVSRAATGGGADLAGWTLLGSRTAELHLAMASELGGRPAEPKESSAAAQGGCELARAVLADLSRSPRNVWTKYVSDLADRVLAESGSLIDSLQGSLPEGSFVQRVHGDFHLGQILRTAEDWVILDFEGEPARTPAERRLFAPAAKDVSGMLRSFDYASRAGLPEGAGDLGRDRADAWKHQVRKAFLAGYFATNGIGAVWPADPHSRQELLNRYEAEKAFYELRYELAHRPDWLAIPLGGLIALAASAT